MKNEIRDSLEQEVRDLTRLSRLNQETMAKMAKELEYYRTTAPVPTPCENCEKQLVMLNQLKAKLEHRENQILSMLDRVLRED